MSAGWVAACVRAVAMSRRRIGSDGAAAIASCRSLDEALRLLTGSPYDALQSEQGRNLAAAEHGVASRYLWNLRVLAGWVPPAGVAMLRLAAGWFEIANVENTLFTTDSANTYDAPRRYELGALSTSWRRLSSASTVSQLRSLLAASWWSDPGSDEPPAIGVTMRSRLIDAASATIPGANDWASAAAALLIAREQLLGNRELPARARRSLTDVVGAEAVGASSLTQLAAALPPSTRWILTAIETPDDLWRAEIRWWIHLERDGHALMRRSLPGPEPIIGTAAVMAADAWRARAALELAAHGGGDLGSLHAVA